MPQCRPLALAFLIAATPVASALAPPATTPKTSSGPTPSPSPRVAPSTKASPVFKPAERAVTTWRSEAVNSLTFTADQAQTLLGTGAAPPVARCVKLNNYWCIKKAGWDGEIAADGEGHVAFASAVEGAAVAAILLKRYYIDFNRKSAMAIISHWAPAQCGLVVAAGAPQRPRKIARITAPIGLANTLRARWLAGHARGFVTPAAGRKALAPRRSVVANRIQRMMPTPTIAIGLGEPTRPMTLDALLMSSPNAPPSRSMLGLPRAPRPGPIALLGGGGHGGISGCNSDSARIASYAAKAAAGITPGPGDDLALFTPNGTPSPNLATMMENMARVEIGPLGAKPSLVEAGIAAAFRPGRNSATP